MQNSTVQGHAGSKFTGPIKSPLMVCYLTSFESNIVSVFIFEIFDEQVLWPRSRAVKGHPRSKVMLPIDSPWVTPCWTLIETSLCHNYANVVSVVSDNKIVIRHTCNYYKTYRNIIQAKHNLRTKTKIKLHLTIEQFLRVRYCYW